MGICFLHAWPVFILSLAAFHCEGDRGPTFVSLFLGRYHFAGSHRYSHVFVVRNYDVCVICDGIYFPSTFVVRWHEG